MKRAMFPLMVATLLIASAAFGQGALFPPPPPPDWLADSFVQSGLKTTILVRVVEALPQATFPPEFNPPNTYVPIRGKVLVLKSWWGPFSAGQVLHVTAVVLCGGTTESCTDYPLRSGDELLIATERTEEPLFATLSDTWPVANSPALIAALDQAVADSMPTDKEAYLARWLAEKAALHDLTIKLQAAQSNGAPGDEIADLRDQVNFHNRKSQRWLTRLISLGWRPPDIRALQGEVYGVGPGTSLADKMELAYTYYGASDIPSVCWQLTAFVNEVTAQNGTSISQSSAKHIVSDAQDLQARLSCK